MAAGVVDPDSIEFTTASNAGAGLNEYDLYVGNIGAVQINSGTGTWNTPMVLTGTSVADASNNINNNGSIGVWQLSQSGTLIINANTVDAGQAIVFEDATDTLVIGQVVNGGSAGISGVVPTIAAGAENLLAAGGFAAQIWGYQSGDQILFNNLTVVSDSIVNLNTLELFGAGNTELGSLTFLIKSGNKPLGAAAMAAAAAQVICFVEGTYIATADGEVLIQRLSVGDSVLTASGVAKPIIWIGTGKVLATRGRRSAATPVIVRRSALADNVPHRDLHVTKGHSLYLDGVLIPVEFLVNHRSIEWDDRGQEVTIYHIELDTHDVLIANGAPAESYRDDGNCWLFQNSNLAWHQPDKPPCAPVLTGGPVVDAVWRRLLDRSGLRFDVATTHEPDLHLLVNGGRVDGRALGNGVHAFRLSNPPSTVRIVSRASAQDVLGLARDPRVLGVALRRVMLWRGRHLKMLDADDERLSDGFHAFEADNGFRWTDGNALLPAALFDGVDGGCELELYVGCTTHYELIEDQVRVAA